ncbi:hypothetical protein TNIN_134211 [Trichonephila inaurata madagascariensis]|uniref:Uncharacterized protein n=1 Tax=Trichonephila inaurata madagascariensis TaxID=2747483 RepID=A0A8X7BSI7_9ARAC|nr:hypothetical protein TNIN_134211 [Trichonephila inaurata madagascariensis]
MTKDHYRFEPGQNGLRNNVLECREGMRKTETDHEQVSRLRTSAPSLHPVTQQPDENKEIKDVLKKSIEETTKSNDACHGPRKFSLLSPAANDSYCRWICGLQHRIREIHSRALSLFNEV